MALQPLGQLFEPRSLYWYWAEGAGVGLSVCQDGAYDGTGVGESVGHAPHVAPPHGCPWAVPAEGMAAHLKLALLPA